MDRRTRAAVAITALTLAGSAACTAALARPPTVTNSPGYEARLAESRKARLAPQPVVQPRKHRPKAPPALPPR